jgi:hypothetical protein
MSNEATGEVAKFGPRIAFARNGTDAVAAYDPLKWYDEKADNPPWIRALAEVRHRATKEGYCFHHIQAIIVSIDQYAETALGNRDYFLNKPYGIGSKKDGIP